jgi:integrase
MARQVDRLSALAVSRAKRKGFFPDGGGLYLQVTASGAKSWVYRFMIHGRAREMGLGPVRVIGLSEARAKAALCRRQRMEGIDPIDSRKAVLNQARLEAASSMTFAECAHAYIKTHQMAWRNSKHAAQWSSSLATYAEPIFGSLPVQGIDTGLVMRVLEPLWGTKSETAGRLRGRIEVILDWAAVRGFRQGENPARWRGHLDMLLPKRSRVTKVRHHSALPYEEIGAFMVRLREQKGVGAQALQFAILTAARTGEVIGTRWEEIDVAAKAWAIPSARMKGGREHRVPLPPAALDMIKTMCETRQSDYLFPGMRAGQPISNMAMLLVLRRMGRGDLTVHGFRSSFRDWAAETTAFANEVVEMALAHVVSNKVEAAYRRGDLFEKRRRLMEEWADFCLKASAFGQVTPIGSAVAFTKSH